MRYYRPKPHPQSYIEKMQSRLLSKVEYDLNGGCWLFSGCLNHSGYGSIGDGNGEVVGAHRLSWDIFIDRIPYGMQVLHRCDVRACVNPSHLWLGKTIDNVRDRDAKGRGNQPKGEKHPFHILTEDQVREIRSFPASGRYKPILASKYGVCEGTIKGIRSRISWKHVP